MTDAVRLIGQMPRAWLAVGAVLVIAVCLFLSDVWWQGMTAALILLGYGGWLFSLQRQPTTQGREADGLHAAELATVEQHLSAMRELLVSVLPLWSRHIELARGQTADAAENLTSRFLGMSQQIHQVLELGAGQEDEGAVGVLRNAQVALPRAVQMLDDTRGERARFLDEIRELSGFVAELHGTSGHHHLRVLLESALDIARKLGLNVVAEGVETREDWMLLRELACNEAQGYFIAKPMPGEALLSWWRGNQERIRLLGASA